MGRDSRRCSTPIDRKGDAVDEAAVITGEEDDRRSKFVGLSYATCWCERCELIHHLLGDCLHHSGARRARRNGVHPNTPPAVFGGPGPEPISDRSTSSAGTLRYRRRL